MLDYRSILRSQFNDQVRVVEKRPGVAQLFLPLFYEDGDMIEIFATPSPDDQSKIRLCDYGMAVMRLSYAYELDTVNKQAIFNKILNQNGLDENDGNIFIDVKPESLTAGVMQYAQGIAKVSSMQMFRKEVVHSLFFEMVREFVKTDLGSFNPYENFLPIPQRRELEVDIAFTLDPTPVYLFMVRDIPKARLAALSCLEFQRSNVSFMSCVVHENMETFGKKDIAILTSAVDKQFPSLDDFKQHGAQFLTRAK